MAIGIPLFGLMRVSSKAKAKLAERVKLSGVVSPVLLIDLMSICIDDRNGSVNTLNIRLDRSSGTKFWKT